MSYFVTGITGFLGKEILSLIGDDGNDYYCLVRERSYKRALEEVKKYKNINLVIGDLANPNILDDEQELSAITNSITKILHSAALYDLEASKENCYIHNVLGTQNIINFARNCKNLKELHYVSTIAIAGDYAGQFKEEDFKKRQSFHDHYSQSKYLAEEMVRSHNLPNVKKIISRPGIIVANSENGDISSVNGPYYLFNLMTRINMKFPILKKAKRFYFPFNENTFFPIIPVNHVAQALCTFMQRTNEKDLDCFHLVSENQPTLRSFLEKTLETWGYDGKLFSLKKSKFNKYIYKSLKMPEELDHYSYSLLALSNNNYKKQFDSISDYNLYKDVMFDFAFERKISL